MLGHIPLPDSIQSVEDFCTIESSCKGLSRSIITKPLKAKTTVSNTTSGSKVANKKNPKGPSNKKTVNKDFPKIIEDYKQNDFNKEEKNPKDVNDDDDDDRSVKERSCDSLVMCIVTTLNQGLRNGGGIGDVLRSPSNHVSSFSDISK